MLIVPPEVATQGPNWAINHSFDQYLSVCYPDTVLYTRNIAEINEQYLPSKNMWLQTGKW